MMRNIIFLVFALLGIASALDHAVGLKRDLINNGTGGKITMNGIWYSLSNSTNNPAEMDSMTDAEACTRDATLMDELGINTIYLMAIDPTKNHDACFSIFNSVGIYVVVALRRDAIFPMTSVDDFLGSYTSDFFKPMFEVIDAVKDYENLLGFDMGIAPSPAAYSYPTNNTFPPYSDGQKLYRAMVRDTKEYIAKNAPRPIMVGASLYIPRNDELLDASDLSASHVYWLSCAIDGNRDDPSRADYVSFWDLGYFETAPVQDQVFGYVSLEEKLSLSAVPVWLQMYGVSDEADYVEYELYPELLNDTMLLFNSSMQLTTGFGALTGGARFTWTNTNIGWKVPISNWGLVNTGPNGEITLTENYNRMREIMASMNTGAWLDGQGLSGGQDLPKCDKAANEMKNTTTDFYFDEPTTITIATDWALPTRPAGMDALITSGVSGKRGQMVDVTVTTIVHAIKDSQGSPVTSFSLKPSKSQTRTTTAAGPSGTATGPGDSTNSSELSTGAKAGIGVGAAIGGLAIAGAAGLYLLRRRRNNKKSAEQIEMGKGGAAGADDYQQHKAELATGPEVERTQAELPVGEKKAYEVAAHQQMPPVELPAYERPVEVSTSHPVGGQSESARRE